MARPHRVLAWSAGAALAAYVALCALLYLQQRRLIYYPQFTRVNAAQTDFALARRDVVLRGWVVNPGRRDAVLYFGGNAESVEENRESFTRALPSHTVYLVAYRGYGASDGEPTEADLLADALALHDDIAKRHPGGRIAVVGRSLGSGVATWVAAERKVSALVLVTPFDSLAAVAQAHYPVFPVRLLLHDRYTPAAPPGEAAGLACGPGPCGATRAHRPAAPGARAAGAGGGFPGGRP
jgi:pimeloyl-ACP methyl ester carboxylesterase